MSGGTSQNQSAHPSTIDLSENESSKKQIVIVTDVLGRLVQNNNKHHCLIYIYDDGSVEKIYKITK